MGTQFWWFYDVLLLSTAAGIFYTAVTKGFRRIVFRILGMLLSVGIAIGCSMILRGMVYESLFRERITSSVQSVLEGEDWDLCEHASNTLALNAAEGESPPDTESLRALEQAVISDPAVECPDWFIEAVSNAVQASVSEQVKPHSAQQLSGSFAADETAFRAFLTAQEEPDKSEAAAVLERLYYRPSYIRLIQLVLFLVILLVMLILCGSISLLAGSSEESVQVTRQKRVLTVPLGLTEVLVVLLIMVAATELLVTLTDGNVLLFNRETIDKTIVFHYLYDWMARL